MTTTLSEPSSGPPDCVASGCAASAAPAVPSAVAVADPVGKLVTLWILPVACHSLGSWKSVEPVVVAVAERGTVGTV